MKFSDIMSQFYQESYILMPKCFFTDEKYKHLSNQAKILYIFLFDRTRLSLQNGWKDENDDIYVYCTIETACQILNKSKNTVIKTYKELENADLVFRKKQRLGKADIVYLKAFSHFDYNKSKRTEENPSS